MATCRPCREERNVENEVVLVVKSQGTETFIWIKCPKCGYEAGPFGTG